MKKKSKYVHEDCCTPVCNKLLYFHQYAVKYYLLMYEQKEMKKGEVGLEVWRLKSQRKVVEFPCMVEDFFNGNNQL